MGQSLRPLLRGIRVGPACLACKEPITLPGRRNGWLHPDCERTNQRSPEQFRQIGGLVQDWEDSGLEADPWAFQLRFVQMLGPAGLPPVALGANGRPLRWTPDPTRFVL